jgi:hypothetical protein
MPVIPDLDEWLLTVVEGLPREMRRYTFRCHPDVAAAIRKAAANEPLDWAAPGGPVASPVGAYGSAAVEVDPALGSGGWELLEHGQVLKSGRIDG